MAVVLNQGVCVPSVWGTQPFDAASWNPAGWFDLFVTSWPVWRMVREASMAKASGTVRTGQTTYLAQGAMALVCNWSLSPLLDQSGN